jgi:hypothetical protein
VSVFEHIFISFRRDPCPSLWLYITINKFICQVLFLFFFKKFLIKTFHITI